MEIELQNGGFTLLFCILQAIKNWMVGRPRNKARCTVDAQSDRMVRKLY